MKRLLVLAAFSATVVLQAQRRDGARLYADVEKYVSFGDHRTGTPANTQTANWLGGELEKYGYSVDYPEFPLRQYFPVKATIVAGADSLSVFPQWWANEGRQTVEGLPLDLTASPTAQADVAGKLVFLRTPEGEFLQPFRWINTWADQGAAGVVVITGSPSGAVAAFNTTATPDPWKIPVALAASRDSARLAAIAALRQPVRLTVEGEYREVKGRNVYGSRGTGGKYIVISTPISGWFICGGERGPGIAVWLALARWAATLETDYTFVFTGNSGHETGGIGAHLFLDERAPAVEDTHLWIHLGAGLATLAYKKTPDGLAKQNGADSLRNFFFSDPVEHSFRKAFAKTNAQKFNVRERNAGELVYVARKGYRRILGVSYIHPYFHTPLDSASTTSPRILADITEAFRQFILQEIDKK